jgi:hypothetical protein
LQNVVRARRIFVLEIKITIIIKIHLSFFHFISAQWHRLLSQSSCFTGDWLAKFSFLPKEIAGINVEVTSEIVVAEFGC